MEKSLSSIHAFIQSMQQKCKLCFSKAGGRAVPTPVQKYSAKMRYPFYKYFKTFVFVVKLFPDMKAIC